MAGMSRWQVMQERGLRDHSNERGSMDAGRSPVLSAIWQDAHGGDGMAVTIGWILSSAEWEPRYTIRADPFKCS